jgi:hypothetical protein
VEEALEESVNEPAGDASILEHNSTRNLGAAFAPLFFPRMDPESARASLASGRTVSYEA